MAESDYSRSMAILVILSPNTQSTASRECGHWVDHSPAQVTNWADKHHSSPNQIRSLPVGSRGTVHTAAAHDILHFRG